MSKTMSLTNRLNDSFSTREYMRRRRAGLPTRAPPKPKNQCCSFCGQPPSQERIVIASGRGVRICEACVAEVAALIAAQRARTWGRSTPRQGAGDPRWLGLPSPDAPSGRF